MITLIQKIQRRMPFPLLLTIVVIVLGILQYGLMTNNVQEKNYDVKLFQVSPETIRAVKTVEDTEQTEIEQQEAANAVDSVYTYSEEVSKNQASIIYSIFDYALDAKNSVRPKDDKKNDKKIEAQQVTILEKSLSKNTATQFELTNDDLRALVRASKSELETTKEVVGDKVKLILSDPLRENNLAEKKEAIANSIRISYSFPENLKNVSIKIARGAIVATEVLDKDATKAKKEEAKEGVVPTRILQGQILVQEGEVIDRSVYHQLQLTGMLSDQVSKKPLIGLALLTALEMLFLFVIFLQSKKATSIKIRNLLIVSIIYIVQIALMELVTIVDHEFDVLIAFMFPAALAPMLLQTIVGERLAVITTVLLGFSSGIIFQEGYSTVMQMEIALYVILSGLSAIYFVRHMHKRSKVMQTSLIVAGINLLFIAFYLLMTQSEYTIKEMVFYVSAACVSALLSGVLTIGLLPFIETTFGFLTSFKLIELSNPNHPLMKKILMEAPGTYHHSIMVANLAEAACEEIGADGLLARVGCYYHDIGKTKLPRYFVENQSNGQNPHDYLPPEKSRDIIIAHAEDGAKILEKHRMPKEIVDIARQHHGTTSVKFFYHKAKKMDESVKENDYRYAGPKPQTKEIAIISIADSVEAAVRSMKDPTPEKVKNLVHAISQDKLQDGQFDECDLTIQELHKIERVFCETLNGTFHSRIEYPEPNKQ